MISLDDLIQALNRAAREQERPYLITDVSDSKGEAFLVELDLSKFEKVSDAPEYFTIKVRFGSKSGRSIAYVAEEHAFSVMQSENGLSLGPELSSEESEGAVETDSIDAQQSWKLFVAERWLLSILRFHEITISRSGGRSRTTVIVVAVVVIGALLIGAFAGISQGMGAGLTDNTQTVKVNPDDKDKDQVLKDFYG